MVSLTDKLQQMQDIIDNLQRRLDLHIDGSFKMPDEIAGAYTGKIEGMALAMKIMRNDDPNKVVF